MVGNDDAIKQVILDWMHKSGVGGHSGIHATLQRVQTLFFWSGMKQSVTDFIKMC